jgi:acyl CoA:acetate/3-ketoacid CoA transferase beta subunit
VIVTERSVFRLVDGGLHLTELLGGSSVDDVKEVTEAPFVVALEETHAAR